MFRDQVKISFKGRFCQFILMGVIFLSSFSACMTEKPANGVLTEQEMMKVLSELYIAEDKIGRVGISYDSIKKIFPKFEAKVFEKLNVNDSVFYKSLEYYVANPKKLEHIYAAVVDSLNLKAQSATTRAEK
jgi:hypothetical protein